MNYHKKGLRRLLSAILENDVGRLVLTHKDRLLRFSAELVFAICEAKQVEVVILNQGEDTSFEENLAKTCWSSLPCSALTYMEVIPARIKNCSIAYGKL